ncbi:MFS transporter [Saccharolobus islandicus]|uniref:Major facilitator superfamily MFS_1 n=1 Tax=Saccharolobus islandicus (strain REY15A) TaxID=930945 RepID=F0NCA6_SACI5|nr:MFS transporter [Sulfolobus islandicus]ADX86545.1 major facilitator superfamily MFS_1 [Sulfolobus islandicus REY15A]
MQEDYGYTFLLLSRVLRSVGIIYITLSSSLYLSAIGVKPEIIGIIFLGAIGFSSGLNLALGMIGDRTGYKKVLIFVEILASIASILLALSINQILIFAALIIGGVGGAAGGIRGVFSPGLTALVASNWNDEKERIRRLSFLMSASSLSGIGGSILLSLRSYISNSVDGYRMLYFISFVLLLASAISLLFCKEVTRPKKTSKVMKKSSMKFISKVVVSNSITGFGLGIAIPLLPLWYNLAFHANSFEIGLIFTISYLTTAIGSLLSNKIRFDPLKVASITRILNGVFLIAMALSPWLPLAAGLYIARGLNAGVGAPNRSAVNVRGVSAEDFGTASSFQGLATRLSQMSSAISGYLLDVSYSLPLEIGGLLQTVGGYLYMKLLATSTNKKVDS